MKDSHDQIVFYGQFRWGWKSLSQHPKSFFSCENITCPNAIKLTCWMSNSGTDALELLKFRALAGWDVIPDIPLRHHTHDIQFLNAARSSYQSLEIRHRLQNQSREARKTQSDGFLYPSWSAAFWYHRLATVWLPDITRLCCRLVDGVAVIFLFLVCLTLGCCFLSIHWWLMHGWFPSGILPSSSSCWSNHHGCRNPPTVAFGS